jgi:ADP-ribosyl-[dinitrogen reductase] hydrolase
LTKNKLPDLACRARGAYLGLAIGDALGATVEFMTAGEIRHQYGVHREIVGGGWLKLKPGQVTDDTQMSLAMGRAIIDSGGFDLRAIAEAWADWLRSRPIDVGNTCRRGIQRYIIDGSLRKEASEGDAGNGALMRNLPVILLTRDQPRLLTELSLQQAHLTHHHPLSDAALVAFARITADLLAGRAPAAVRAHADALVAEHRCFRFEPYPRRASGYVVDTVQTTLSAFFAADSFEDCLLRAIQWGGDADTNGAIVGWLAGAAFGEAAIPARWLKKLDPAVRGEIDAQVPALLRLGSGIGSAPPPAA